MYLGCFPNPQASEAGLELLILLPLKYANAGVRGIGHHHQQGVSPIQGERPGKTR